MQLFVRSSAGPTLTLTLAADSQVGDIKQRLEECDSVPAGLQCLRYGGRVLDEDWRLCDCQIKNGATLSSHLRLLGGAAARAKAAALAAQKKMEMEEEYNEWHAVADQTATTGVMRVLCVSMILDQDRDPVQGSEDELSPFFGDSPASECYDDSGGNSNNGYAEQPAYDEAFKTLMDHFVSEHWDMMKVLPEKGNEGKRIYTHSGIEGKKDAKVEVLCGDDYFDGLWYKGPVKIVDCETGEAVWDIEEQAKERKLWVEYTDPSTGQAYKGFRTPWRIAGLYADIERWMFGGIGMTTYTLNAKDQLTLWSQQDTSGSLGLTDREKMRLRQIMQLSAKEAKGKSLSPEETILQKEVSKLVECSPSHHDQSGIYSWQIKSLKKILENKVVFWTNSENDLPCGSVADKSKKTDEEVKLGNGIKENGSGNEIMEFWKYEKKIGAIRKKYVMEDRQRLLDTIERFTPTYKAVLKNIGKDAKDDSGDHYMIYDYQRKIVNVVSLALDMHMPDFQEDKIACFIKTLVEKRLGPTWHVLVGRSFGFSVQCEARHFIHLYMQHLAVVIWKSEPDPQAGKK